MGILLMTKILMLIYITGQHSKSQLYTHIQIHVCQFHHSKTLHPWRYHHSTRSYNPIGDMIGSCPPEDWRNPPVMDMYNQITRKMANKHNITVIDTNEIVGITWDRSEDWCHIKDISGDLESWYMLYRLYDE